MLNIFIQDSTKYGVCGMLWYIYTTNQKFLNSPSLHLFDPKYSKSSNIVKNVFALL